MGYSIFYINDVFIGGLIMIRQNKRTELEKQLQMENEYLKKEIVLLKEQIEFYKDMLNTTNDNEDDDLWWIFE